MSDLRELSAQLAAVVAGAAPSVVGVGPRGSGVVVAPGLVLTNAHNARGNTVVHFSDGREVQASLTGADTDGDLAVLRAGTEGITPLEWAPTAPSLGEIVVGLARPGGRGARAGVGFVSGSEMAFRGPEGRLVRGALEHTAQMAPGSSGGPLVDIEGRLVGINTHRHREGAYLAIPAGAQLRARTDALAEGRQPQRRRLGVAIAHPRVAQKLRQAVGLPERPGLLVHDVDPEGPAAKAGLRRGDFIVAVNAQPVADADQLADALERVPDGEPAQVSALRGAEELSFSVA